MLWLWSSKDADFHTGNECTRVHEGLGVWVVVDSRDTYLESQLMRTMAYYLLQYQTIASADMAAARGPRL